MEDQIQKLELKITELENKLKELSAGHPSAIDPEELKTYQKVHSQLSPIICNCYHCFVCYVCRVCHVCINECSCGPCGACIQYSPTQSAGAGFGGFMK